jgi:hypothetical protein
MKNILLYDHVYHFCFHEIKIKQFHNYNFFFFLSYPPSNIDFKLIGLLNSINIYLRLKFKIRVNAY